MTEIELRAKRIVALGNQTVNFVCFEYEHDQLEKYEPLVGEEVKIKLVDTNGEFVSARTFLLIDVSAPNRGNTLGGADDVLIITAEKTT